VTGKNGKSVPRETIPVLSRFHFDIPSEWNMTDGKKHDLREGHPKATITNTNSRMAGGADNPNVDTDQNPQLVKPGPEGRVPEGDNVKGS